MKPKEFNWEEFQKQKTEQVEQKQSSATWREKLETTEANAIALLGECFRVGGLGWVKIADLETNLDPKAAEEAQLFAVKMGWTELGNKDPGGHDIECIITVKGLGKLRFERLYGRKGLKTHRQKPRL